MTPFGLGRDADAHVVSSAIALEAAWLSVEQLGEDLLVVTARHGIAAGRAELLWSALEGALERARDRVVVAELSTVTIFDGASIRALWCVARACRRRHAALCAVMGTGTALAQYAHHCGLSGQLRTYSSIPAALGELAHGDYTASTVGHLHGVR